MSPPETVMAPAAVPATAPAFAAFVPAGVAKTEAPMASASEPANKNATSGPAMAAVGKKLGELWRAMSDSEKVPYNKKADADKVRYEKAKAAYKPK